MASYIKIPYSNLIKYYNGYCTLALAAWQAILPLDAVQVGSEHLFTLFKREPTKENPF